MFEMAPSVRVLDGRKKWQHTSGTASPGDAVKWRTAREGEEEEKKEESGEERGEEEAAVVTRQASDDERRLKKRKRRRPVDLEGTVEIPPSSEDFSPKEEKRKRKKQRAASVGKRVKKGRLAVVRASASRGKSVVCDDEIVGERRELQTTAEENTPQYSLRKEEPRVDEFSTNPGGNMKLAQKLRKVSGKRGRDSGVVSVKVVKKAAGRGERRGRKAGVTAEELLASSLVVGGIGEGEESAWT